MVCTKCISANATHDEMFSDDGAESSEIIYCRYCGQTANLLPTKHTDILLTIAQMVQVDDHQCVIYVGVVVWNSSDYQSIELHHAVMIVGYQWCYWVLHNNEVYDSSSRMSDKSVNRKVWEVFSV